MRFVLLFVVVVNIFCGSAGKAENFSLVVDGRPAVRIELVVATEDRKSAEQDVALFNRYLKEVTGTALPTNGLSARTLRVTVRPIVSLAARYNWEWTFPSKNSMELVATRTSLFTALRHVLEESCDARFLGVEKCMFQYEPCRDVSVLCKTRRNARHSYSLLRAITNDPGRFRELGVDGDSLFVFSHGVPVNMFPAEKYAPTNWPIAIMPTYKGKKLFRPKRLYAGWQPCYSNPETVRLAVSNILGYLKKYPEKRSVTLGVNDCTGYCECERCLAADANARPATFYNANPNRSGSYWGFASKVADEVSHSCPGLRYGALAYTGTSEPPEFEINRKIVPIMTMTTAACVMDPKMGQKQDDLIRRWGEQVDETGIWEYDWGRPFYIPRVGFSVSARRLKYLYENGGRAYFAENRTDALDGPKIYLKARLLEDIDADPEAILNEWYMRFAGEAAASDLRAIYAACESFWSSAKMQQTAWWRMRGAICLMPSSQAYPALVPGFTENIVSLAQRVLESASTPGEKRRADVLLRHFQLMDAVLTFRGYAYQDAYSGAVSTQEACRDMIDDFVRRAPAIFAEWPKVDAYFSSCDMPDSNYYIALDIISLDPVTDCAGMAAEIARHMGSEMVASAYRRLFDLKCLPTDVRKVFIRVCSDKTVNAFSNPGFAKPLDRMSIKTDACKGEIVDCPNMPGGKALRIVTTEEDCRQIAYTFTENLEPGTWIVTSKMRGGSRAEFTAWPQTGGMNNEERVFAHSPMSNDWRTFSCRSTVGIGQSGLNLIIRAIGVGKEGMLVGNIRVVKVADPDPRKSRGQAKAKAFSCRCGSSYEMVYGEEALVNRNKDAYYFAEFGLSIPLLRPQDTMQFKLRAAVPEGDDGGVLGVMLLENDGKGGVKTIAQPCWDRRLSSGGYEVVAFELKGTALGKTSGRFRLFFYKIGNVGALAITSLSWHTHRGDSGK